jgi:hypothetical protein
VRYLLGQTANDRRRSKILLLVKTLDPDAKPLKKSRILDRSEAPSLRLTRAFQMIPPLALITWPLIHEPSEPARKATALAISSGCPKRSRGASFAI